MKTYLLAIVLMVALILVNSCGTGDQLRTTNAMEASKAAYERCLAQNPRDQAKCEVLKRKYEADLKAYREARERTGPIVTGFFEFGPGDGRH